MPDAEYRAHLETRLNTLETTIKMVEEVMHNMFADVLRLEKCHEAMRSEVAELRDAAEGKS